MRHYLTVPAISHFLGIVMAMYHDDHGDPALPRPSHGRHREGLTDLSAFVVRRSVDA
jgi:hypothetical protein